MRNDRNKVLSVLGSNYTEEPRTYIAANEYKKENIRPYIWNLDTNEITDVDLTEIIRAETKDKLTSYPQYALSPDRKKLVAALFKK
ncbi:hypothetical protein T458_24145 [Brevibacillus panacihumi W25]|uniref:Uncharacterized protein n=2 Tax=Brevibacillus panacihumi TaxID=497735 RepID=V6M1E0_9BACL|nr:hypothetical protein T458_24145 [Brevibacillus panacihumi W25]